MKELMTECRDMLTSRKYFNEITECLNKYLFEGYAKCVANYGETFGTYLENFDEEYFLIRVPGATRGNIRHKDGVIQEIMFYPTAERCFKGSYEEDAKQFIGCKLVLTPREE